MPSAPISSVASALNFGNCRTVSSDASATIQEYTAMRYRRYDADCDGTHPDGTIFPGRPGLPRACQQSSSVIYHTITIRQDNSHAGGRGFEFRLALILGTVSRLRARPDR